MKHRILSGLVAATLAAGPASAATLSDVFTSFFVLGDSNSDFGNLGPDGPPPPYFNSQFSNGPVWADILDDQFETGDPNDIRTWNYAFGGAKVTETSNVPDLPTQLNVFAADLDPSVPDPLDGTPTLGDRPLVSVWFGANDIRGIYTSYLDAVDAAVALNGAAKDAAILAAQTTAKSEAQSVGALYGSILGNISGFPQFGDLLALTTADAGLTPEYPNLTDSMFLTQLSALFNDQLNQSLAAIAASGVNVYTVDIFQLQKDVGANPAAFGFTNVTDPCLTFGATGPAICSNPDDYLFWDEVGHLSGSAHAALAGIVENTVLAGVAIQSVTPVPLPASLPALAIGLGLMGALRLRQTRRA
jgi:outer membrane lipase/esterase